MKYINKFKCITNYREKIFRIILFIFNSFHEHGMLTFLYEWITVNIEV